MATRVRDIDGTTDRIRAYSAGSFWFNASMSCSRESSRATLGTIVVGVNPVSWDARGLPHGHVVSYFEGEYVYTLTNAGTRNLDGTLRRVSKRFGCVRRPNVHTPWVEKPTDQDLDIEQANDHRSRENTFKWLSER